jgi:hypothetical protein
MFSALSSESQNAIKRIVVYSACVSVLVLAALSFVFRGGLQAPKDTSVKRGIFGVVAQNQPRLVASYGKLPLSFEANQGQADAGVKFLSRGRGYGLFLTSSEAVLELRKSSVVSGRLSVGTKQNPRVRTQAPDGKRGRRTNFLIENRQSKIENQVVRLRLVGAKPHAAVTGSEELPGKANYFIGNDPKKWRADVPTYAKVRYQNVYPGIDLVYYGNQGGQLEYDFIVAPGADPGAIALDAGAAREPPLRIDAHGDLVISAKGGEVRFRKPRVYQEQSTVDSPQLKVRNETRKPKVVNRQSTIVHRQFREGRFRLDAQNRVRFALGPYDHSKPLVIDPELVYSTYLGGDTNINGLTDQASAIAVDSSGDAYVTGITVSTKFPVANAFQPTNKAADGTAFVSKFNVSGSSLIYSTYLGGSASDQGNAIAVDSAGSAYVTGSTCSSDFPTALPLQASLKGPCDGFVTKLNASGTSLVYSTFLGGSGVPANYPNSAVTDEGTGIAVDSAGSAYVTGVTLSKDFPTVNPIQGFGGGSNAFLCKFNVNGTTLVYSTYLGGSAYDKGAGIAVDSSGNAYVIGTTLSVDFPLVNAFEGLPGEYVEIYGTAFMAKLNSTGSALVYSSYLGGGVSEEGKGIAVDSAGNAYLTGATWSSNFPTVNPLQPTNQAAASLASNAFVSKLNPAGSALVYSTYLGGSGVLFNPGVGPYGDYGLAIAINPTGVACVGGQTASTDFPTVNAIQATDNNTYSPFSFTGFVACLNGAGSALAYSTYLGGNSQAQANGIAVDASGNAYVAGAMEGSGFPTVNPFQASVGGAFVAMISPPPALTILPGTLSFGTVVGGTTSPPQSVVATPLSTASVSSTSITASGDFALVTTPTSCPYGGGTVAAEATCTIDATFSPTATGNRTGTVTINYTGAGSPETVALSGVGIAPPASISPAILSFSNQDVGSSSAPQAVTLTNQGPLVLGISAVATSSGWIETNNCLPSVAANSSCTINVSFQPAFFGPQTGTLTITDAATNSPQAVTLSGTALAPVVNLSSTSLTFSAQTVSTKSAPQTITLTNAGNGALTPLKITRTGPFAQTNTCGDSVAAGASCTISVTFSPLGAGSQSGTITLTDNAADSPRVVELSGTGMDFAVTSSTTSQTVSAGQTANYSLTLAPQGGFSQTVNLTCTGAPSESTCTLTPNTVTLNGTASVAVAVAVSTTAPSLAPPQGRLLPPGMRGLGRVFWLYALLWLASLATLAAARKRRAAYLLGACLLLAMLWSACGGGGTKTVPPPIHPGTPAGTYTVDVTATDASTSTLTHTIQLTLTVN